MSPTGLCGCHFRSAFNLFAPRRILVLAALLIWTGTVHRQNGVLFAGQSEYKGRRIAQVMGAAGADWLTREDREKFEQPEKVLIVDARTEDEYRQGHIPNAVNIPPSQFTSIGKYLPKDKSLPIIFYCRGYS